MIKSFSVPDLSVNEFIKKVSDSLTGRELGKIASMNVSGENVLVTFSKLGKSEVVFALSQAGSGFKCTHQSEKIAMLHKPLRADIETKLARVLELNGAKVEEA